MNLRDLQLRIAQVQDGINTAHPEFAAMTQVDLPNAEESAPVESKPSDKANKVVGVLDKTLTAEFYMELGGWLTKQLGPILAKLGTAGSAISFVGKLELLKDALFNLVATPGFALLVKKGLLRRDAMIGTTGVKGFGSGLFNYAALGVIFNNLIEDYLGPYLENHFRSQGYHVRNHQIEYWLKAIGFVGAASASAISAYAGGGPGGSFAINSAAAAAGNIGSEAFKAVTETMDARARAKKVDKESRDYLTNKAPAIQVFLDYQEQFGVPKAIEAVKTNTLVDDKGNNVSGIVEDWLLNESKTYGNQYRTMSKLTPQVAETYSKITAEDLDSAAIELLNQIQILGQEMRQDVNFMSITMGLDRGYEIIVENINKIPKEKQQAIIDQFKTSYSNYRVRIAALSQKCMDILAAGEKQGLYVEQLAAKLSAELGPLYRTLQDVRDAQDALRGITPASVPEEGEGG